MSSTIVILGTGLGLGLPAIALFLLSRRNDKRLKLRLQRVSEPLRAPAMAVDPEIDGDIFRSVKSRAQSGRFWQAVQARYPLIEAKRALPRAVAIGIATGIFSLAAMWFLRIGSGWWTGPIGGFAAWGGMVYAMSMFHGRQVAEFTRQFPDTIDQIVRLSRAGVPSLEAIAVITEDSHPPVEPVLRDVCEGLLAGLDPDTALRGVSARVRLSEFTLFTAVIRLQRRSGGSVSTAFSNLSATLRERRNTALKARASTAQTRLTLLVLSVMPILVLVGQKFLAPDAVDMLFGTDNGNSLLHWGVGLIVTGLLVARFIASRAEQ